MNPHATPDALPLRFAAPDHERELEANLELARLNCSYNRKQTESVVQQAKLMQEMLRNKFGEDLEDSGEEDTLEQMFGRSVRRKKQQYRLFLKCLDLTYLVQLNYQQQDGLDLFQPVL